MASGERELIAAILAQAVADILWARLAARDGEDFCPISLDEAEKFVICSPKVSSQLKKIKSSKEIKRCLRRLEKLLNRP